MEHFTPFSSLAGGWDKTDPVYPAALEALLDWVARGVKPTPEQLAARCTALEARFGPGCRFLPGYRSAPLETRVAPR